MAFRGELEDSIAVRQRIETYADAVFRKDATDWATCWAEDGVWNLGAGEVSGKIAIVAAWKKAMEGFRFVSFQVWIGGIDIDGDSAKARSHTQEVLFPTDGPERRILGRYEDELARVDGVWLFVRRTYSVQDSKAA